MVETRVGTPDPSSEAWFRSWISGDAEAGRQLIQHFYRRIFRFFFDKVGAEVARDLTQETFETLCARKEDFRGDSSIGSFLFGIARWKLVHHFERQRVHGERFRPASDSLELPAVATSITSLFSNRQREIILVRALRTLALDDQIILELKDYESMTARDIAAAFGVGRDTMSTRITRARRRLVNAVKTLAESASLVSSTQSNLDDEMRRIRQHIEAAALGGHPQPS